MRLAVIDRGPHHLALTAGLDEAMFLWDLAAQREIARASVGFTHFVGVDEADGQIVAMVAGIGFADVHHLGAGVTMPVRVAEPHEPASASTLLAGATGRLGRRPVAALVSASGRLRLYGLATGEALGRSIDVTVKEGREPGDRPEAVALFAVHGRPAAVVLTGDHGPHARFVTELWDLDSGTRLARLEPAVSDAVATAIVDGRPVVVTPGPHGLLQVWDAAGQRTVRTIRTGARVINFLATGLLHGRPVALATGHDGPLTTWDLATGAALDEIRLPDTCRGIALGEQGTLVVAIENDIAVIETEIRGVVPQLSREAS
jgi:hypothetical protein